MNKIVLPNHFSWNCKAGFRKCVWLTSCLLRCNTSRNNLSSRGCPFSIQATLQWTRRDQEMPCMCVTEGTSNMRHPSYQPFYLSLMLKVTYNMFIWIQPSVFAYDWQLDRTTLTVFKCNMTQTTQVALDKSV